MSHLEWHYIALPVPSPRRKTSALVYLELELSQFDDVDTVESQNMHYMNWSNQINTAIDDQVVSHVVVMTP